MKSYIMKRWDITEQMWDDGGAIILIGATCIGAFLMIEENLLTNGTYRYFRLAEALLVVLATPLLAHLAYKKLIRKEWNVKKTKIYAEIASGIALTGLFLSLFNTGVDMDRLNVGARFQNIIASQQLFTDLKICRPSSANENVPCKQIDEDFRLARTAVFDRNEEPTKAALTKLQTSINAVAPSSDQKFEKIYYYINQAKVDDTDAKFYATIIIQFMLMISGMSAVSRKIALAFYDPPKPKIEDWS